MVPDVINRFNMFTTINITGNTTPGFSSGRAIEAIAEVAEQTLPTGFGYDFSGLTREEANTGQARQAIFSALFSCLCI